jgi:NAD(P)-dependent dehydrogenase (short-subunit alcohol dehydrogenase family)
LNHGLKTITSVPPERHQSNIPIFSPSNFSRGEIDIVDDPACDAYVKSLVPMHRWGRAEEAAQAILFLASVRSSFTKGANLRMDGGMAHA